MPQRRWALSPSSSCPWSCRLDSSEYTHVPHESQELHSGSLVLHSPLLVYAGERAFLTCLNCHGCVLASCQVCEWKEPEELKQLLDLELQSQGESQEQILERCRTVIHYSVKTGGPGNLAGGVSVPSSTQVHPETPACSPFSRSPPVLQPALLRFRSPCSGWAHHHREPQHQPVSHLGPLCLQRAWVCWGSHLGRTGRWFLPLAPVFYKRLLRECFPSCLSFGLLFPAPLCLLPLCFLM